VLRIIFVPKREHVAEDWRRLHNETLHILYASLTIVRFIKPKMRWEGHVARIRKVFWVENLKGRDHSEDIDVDDKIT
jgi:hypothetical protein